jgi:hypothetical protein
MKEINSLTLDEINNIKDILVLKQANGQDVQKMKHIMNTYIDNKCYVCSNCPAQIRMVHQRIINWYNINKNQIQQIEEDIKEPNSDFRECRKCGEDISQYNKKIKYCPDCRNIK